MTQSNLTIFWAYCKTMRQRQLFNVKVPNGIDFASHCKPTCMLEPGWSCLSLPPQPKILKDRLGCKVLKECFRQMVICQARGSVLQSTKTTECPFQRIISSNNIQLTCTLQERDFLFALRARDDVAEDRSLSTQSNFLFIQDCGCGPRVSGLLRESFCVCRTTCGVDLRLIMATRSGKVKDLGWDVWVCFQSPTPGLFRD